ncbi:MAG: hypothetical protein MIO92_06960, partial [Methanosarcinaceae archaeon]|nr:hypothetical protein [Methanosarcinaceae archaeon]
WKQQVVADTQLKEVRYKVWNGTSETTDSVVRKLEDGKWASTLSEPQRTAFDHYKGSFYARMNEYLRGKRESLDPQYLAMIEEMRKDFEWELPQNTVLFRGSNIPELAELFDAESKGMIGASIIDKGFMSTSINKRMGDSFSSLGKDIVVFEIRAKAGTKCAPIEVIRGRQESEILFKDHSRFKIVDTRVDYRAGGEDQIKVPVRYITMETEDE